MRSDTDENDGVDSHFSGAYRNIDCGLLNYASQRQDEENEHFGAS